MRRLTPMSIEDGELHLLSAQLDDGGPVHRLATVPTGAADAPLLLFDGLLVVFPGGKCSLAPGKSQADVLAWLQRAAWAAADALNGPAPTRNAA